ncbi:MAG: von Willebrand factor type A domain-containing protein [Planctomycetes bacterium]|nr:von Willebrand factor type A domain-containing protein [Planctomycetota bacterium]
MNTDTNDFEARPAPNEGDRLHQLLCATILGEASDAERAEVERALAGSPELRAERERLAATIGLFQGALTDGEKLSPAAERELATALTRRRRKPWYAQPLFRIAAAIVAVGSVGYVGWRKLDLSFPARHADVAPRTETPPPRDQVAKLEREAPAELQRLGYLGYATGDAPSSSEQRADAEVDRKTRGGQAGERSEKRKDSDGSEILAARSLTKLGEADGLDDEAQKVIVGTMVPFTESSDTGTAQHQLAGDDRAAAAETPQAPGAVLVARNGSLPGVSIDDVNGFGKTTGNPTYLDYEAFAKDLSGRAGEKKEQDEGLRGLGYLGGDPVDRVSPPKEDRDEERERGGQVTLRGNEFVREQVLDSATIDARIDAILGACRRRPDERPRDMFFRFWGDNAFEYPQFDRLSTFSVDVDTASYTLARNYLAKGFLPEKQAVRTEEFLNYFKGDVRPPEKGTFAIETELAPSLFGETRDTLMLRVAIRGKEISKAERTPVALTFVIDVSGSMREENRLELVKNALRLLATQLDARDWVSIVTFSNDATLVLPMTSAKNRLAIEQALQPLEPQSGTNTESGLRLGYQQAFANRDPSRQNRVVLLTDGVANVGITDPNALTQQVSEQRRAGIYLNTIGVGMNNHNDGLLEQLADKGDGLCNYVDDEAEAKRALVDNFTGAFQPIARDVKVQVEFDPAQVVRYRLLGYENRAIADQDFRNDKIDAGEVGAGHQVVALYELVPGPSLGDGPLATVRLRWKDPYGEGTVDKSLEQAHETAHPVTQKSATGSYEQTSAGYRRSALVAQFAEFLRRSVHADGDSFERLVLESRKLARELKDKEFDEFVALIEKSKELILARIAQVDPCDARLDELRRLECRRAEAETLRRVENDVAAIEGRRATLEAELRDCLRQRIQTRQR